MKSRVIEAQHLEATSSSVCNDILSAGDESPTLRVIHLLLMQRGFPTFHSPATFDKLEESRDDLSEAQKKAGGETVI